MILKNCYNLVHKNTVSISMWLIFTVTWKDQKEIGLFLQWNIMVSIGKYERLTRYHKFSVLMAIRKHIVNLSYPSILPRKQKMEKRTMTTAINKWIKPSPRTLVHMFKYHKDWVLYPMSLIKAVDAAEGNLVAHRAEPWFSEQPVNQKLWSPAAEGMLIGVPWWPLWLTFPFPAPPFVLCYTQFSWRKNNTQFHRWIFKFSICFMSLRLNALILRDTNTCSGGATLWF